MKTQRQPKPCERCILDHECFPIHSDTNQHLLKDIVEESVLLKKGEILFHQREKFRGLYAIKSGGLKTVLANEEGEERVVAFYLPGEIVGLDAVCNDQYEKNCEALLDSEVCRLPFSALLSLASRDCAIQKNLFKLFSYKIRQSIRHFHCNAEQKVAGFLLDYSRRLSYQNQDGENFSLLLNQQDIASYLELTPETVSRVMRKFNQEGILHSPKNKSINHLDISQLEKLVR